MINGDTFLKVQATQLRINARWLWKTFFRFNKKKNLLINLIKAFN